MNLVPIKWNEVKGYPVAFTPDKGYVNILPLSIQKDGIEYGIYVLMTHPSGQVEAQLFVKEEWRGRALTRSTWKQFYTYVFDIFNFKELVARTENPLMANILKRENWREISEDFWLITKDKVRYKI